MKLVKYANNDTTTILENKEIKRNYIKALYNSQTDYGIKKMMVSLLKHQ